MEHRAESVRDALEVLFKGTDLPPEIEQIRDQVSATPAAAMGAEYAIRYDLDEALSRLRLTLDERSWELVQARTLSIEPPPKLRELASNYTLTRARVQQIEAKSAGRLRQAAGAISGGLANRAATRLAREIGVAMRLSSASQLSSVESLGGLDDVRVRILLWLGGPYRAADGWLVRTTATDVASDTKRLLFELTARSPVNIATAAEAVVSQGVSAAEAAAWLERVPNFKHVGDQIVRWGPSMADKAHTVLILAHTPMTREELFGAIGGTSLRSMTNQLFADSRFKRTSLRDFGLAGWHHDEYTSVADEIREEVERQGGQAHLQQLVRVVSERYHVADSSVRAYALGPGFVRSPDGLIRNRRADERPVLKTQPTALTRAVYIRSDGYSIRLPVTEALLRGSGVPIPNSLAVALGLAPTDSKTYELNGIQQLWVGWPSLQPSIGSLRHALQSLHATDGDELFLDLRRDKTAKVWIVSAAMMAGTAGVDRVALLTGVEGGPGALDRIGVATGLPYPPSPTASEVAARLTARKELDLAALVSATGDRRQERTAGDRFIASLIETLRD
jgi:hypothetical protein